MAIFINGKKYNASVNGGYCRPVVKKVPITGILLVSSDGFVLKDSRNAFVTVKKTTEKEANNNV